MHAQIRANDVCRRWRKPLYAGGTYGLLGYIFCDLLEHEYIASYVFSNMDVADRLLTAAFLFSYSRVRSVVATAPEPSEMGGKTSE